MESPLPVSFDLRQLRLAAALVHSVPQAELTLCTSDGAQVSVGRCAGADLDPCDLRRAVLHSDCPSQLDLSRWLVGAELGGALSCRGGGLYRDVRHDAPRWWTCTLLGPAATEAVLEDVVVPCAPLVDDAVTVTLKPDGGLGVTVVSVGSDHPALAQPVGSLARSVSAALMVEELLVDSVGGGLRR